MSSKEANGPHDRKRKNRHEDTEDEHLVAKRQRHTTRGSREGYKDYRESQWDKQDQKMRKERLEDSDDEHMGEEKRPSRTSRGNRERQQDSETREKGDKEHKNDKRRKEGRNIHSQLRGHEHQRGVKCKKEEYPATGHRNVERREKIKNYEETDMDDRASERRDSKKYNHRKKGRSRHSRKESSKHVKSPIADSMDVKNDESREFLAEQNMYLPAGHSVERQELSAQMVAREENEPRKSPSPTLSDIELSAKYDSRLSRGLRVSSDYALKEAEQETVHQQSSYGYRTTPGYYSHHFYSKRGRW